MSRGEERTCNCGGEAPTSSPTFAPPLKAMKVGILPACQNHNHESNERNTHGFNTNFLGDILGRVNIDLVELDGWGRFGDFFEDGADHPAWTTPVCPKVEDGDLVLADLVIQSELSNGSQVE